MDANSGKSKKTSKRILNLNAVKFKLTNLRTSAIRYEVVYKNLTRDMRKFFSKDFNLDTSFIKGKRKNSGPFFIKCIKAYISERMQDLEILLGVSEEDLVFHLGSLIYPKEIIRLYAQDNTKNKDVLMIYNYLYKFSLERLQKLINNPCLILLFTKYLMVNGYSRINGNKSMQKYAEAYYEACEVMIRKSDYADILGPLLKDTLSNYMYSSNRKGLQSSDCT